MNGSTTSVDRGAEPFQHRLDDVVAQDEDARFLDLRREMAVADMPGKLGEMRRVAATHIVELFLGGDDLDLPAVVQHQHVAMVEHDRLGQIDQHPAAVGEFDDLAAQVPLVMGKHRKASKRLSCAVVNGAGEFGEVG